MWSGWSGSTPWKKSIDAKAEAAAEAAWERLQEQLRAEEAERVRLLGGK